MGSDFWLVVRWWGVLFLVGAAAFPFAKRVFSSWWDQGYFFSKAIGMAIVTYLVYVFGTIHLFSFSIPTILLSMMLIFLVGIYLHRGSDLRITNNELRNHTSYLMSHKSVIVTIVLEELFFLSCLILWSWVKGHEASIRSLEKFMDYGFTKTILQSQYFPIADMWYAGYLINYYYFGHIVMAVLTKLSGLDLAFTFNLMLATIFALTATMSFSIGVQLSAVSHQLSDRQKTKSWKLKAFLAGLLTSFLVTLAGNMQTLYAFTKGYTGENVIPFWELLWKPSEFLQKLPEGLDRYWYANATRFIPFTIHEFPSYSFVVSDMHGHVLSLPFALLAIALLLRMYGEKELRIDREFIGLSIFYGLLTSILLMTNALDGPIYLGLYLTLLGIKGYSGVKRGERWLKYGITGGVVTIVWLIGSLPFLSHFSSFVSGLAINCPPAGLAGRKIGPFLFEGVEKCQHSPFWMWWILWGFFLYCGTALIARNIKYQILNIKYTNKRSNIEKLKSFFLNITASPMESILVIFFFYSLLLVIFPEFFYFKDIYPAHFRSNTMFKLGYQAFIMFSIVAGYTIINFLYNRSLDPLENFKDQKSNIKYKDQKSKIGKKVFIMLLIPQLFLVSIYPLFGVRSYFGGLREYQGLYGLNWMITEYPDDYQAVKWLEKNAKCQTRPPARRVLNAKCELPVIVEADGDSYTDYNHFSAFVGLPTIAGWAVHEWLWRGSYDVVAPRREEVRKVYESANPDEIRQILAKYHVSYIVVGKLERQKFVNLNESAIAKVARSVFHSGETEIFEVFGSQRSI